MQKTYGFHPACLRMPKQDDDEYSALCDSIRSGFDAQKPIMLCDGLILDGRHRYLACLDTGIEPQFMQWIGGDPYDYVRRVHEGSRSWANKVQKALIIGELISDSQAWQSAQLAKREAANAARAEAARTQENRGNQYTKEMTVQVDPQVVGQPPVENPSTRDHAKKHAKSSSTALAKAIGVNRGAVEQANLIQSANRPDLVEKVKSGEVSPAAAVREIRKEKLANQLTEVAAREAEAPTGLFDVIVLDPPWPMQKIERDERPNQVAFDYPTMSENELAEMSIPADQDCHVWVWTTHKFLPMAMRLLEKWGLNYVCTFVWHKPGGFQPIGLPQYNCEFALYARKGNPKFLDTKAFPVCFDAPRGAHSEKPEDFYAVVRRVTGGRRLDMFNRRKIDGFTGWGKESAA